MMNLKKLTSAVSVTGGKLRLHNAAALREEMDGLVSRAVFEENQDLKRELLIFIKEAVKACGAFPASIQGLYEELGRGFRGFTVPAMNIRGLTYDTARAVFRKAMEKNVGTFIFEIARSEIGYTKQRPLEYSTVVLAAAVREGFTGPVFIQGDHFQLVRKNYLADPVAEVTYVRGLIKEAVDAEFYNIDIDSSTLVDLERQAIREQQRPNFEKTAELAQFIRELQPAGIDISIGGEIG
ncbi:MAG TPA: aldolase, partial [Thermodesulfovibrionales bacterium]|nr:aldolase [Thermodesulfovibrionales bacterium]